MPELGDLECVQMKSSSQKYNFGLNSNTMLTMDIRLFMYLYDGFIFTFVMMLLFRNEGDLQLLPSPADEAGMRES